MRKTPGQAAHHEFHQRRRRFEFAARMKREADEGEPPFRTSSHFSIGCFDPRSERYPTQEDTAYMDSRLGMFSLHEEDETAETAFVNALLVLAVYNATAADLVQVMCVKGKVDVEWERVRHRDWLVGARLLKPGLDDDGLDSRTPEGWLARSWAILGWVMLPEGERRKAARDFEESARVQEWLSDVKPR